MQFKTLSRHCILMKNYIGTNLKLHQTSMLVKERLWSNKFSPFSKMEHCNQTNPRIIFTTLVANKADIFSGTRCIFLKILAKIRQMRTCALIDSCRRFTSLFSLASI